MPIPLGIKCPHCGEHMTVVRETTEQVEYSYEEQHKIVTRPAILHLICTVCERRGWIPKSWAKLGPNVKEIMHDQGVGL